MVVKAENTKKKEEAEVAKEVSSVEKSEKKSKKLLSKKSSCPGRGKRYAQALAFVVPGKRYSVLEGFELLTELSYAKFDESVDAAFNLGVDPKHADQMVRGAVVLPHGIGKSVRVAVLAQGEKAKEAMLAGADHVGTDDLIEKIVAGWLDFDKMIATPDMMLAVSKIGKILGPRGLMPNPKLGTVTFDLAKAVKEQKLGKIEYRTEKTGIVHVSIGKKSFGAQKLKENFSVLTSVLLKAKPPTSKGTYLKSIALSTTMSPALWLDPLDAIAAASQV
jgi:large subunit ribosomal protein L1